MVVKTKEVTTNSEWCLRNLIQLRDTPGRLSPALGGGLLSGYPCRRAAPFFQLAVIELRAEAFVGLDGSLTCSICPCPHQSLVGISQASQHRKHKPPHPLCEPHPPLCEPRPPLCEPRPSACVPRPPLFGRGCFLAPSSRLVS